MSENSRNNRCREDFVGAAKKLVITGDWRKSKSQIRAESVTTILTVRLSSRTLRNCGLGLRSHRRQTVARLSPLTPFHSPFANLLYFRIVLPATALRARDKEQFSRVNPFLLHLLGVLVIRSLHINRIIVDRSVPCRAINPKVGNVFCEINASVSHRARLKLFLERKKKDRVLNPPYEHYFINSLNMYDYINIKIHKCYIRNVCTKIIKFIILQISY